MFALNYTVSEAVVDYSPSTRAVLRNVLGMLAPYDCAEVNKVRYGRCNDGGYVMANDFEGVSTAYSLGISNDVSWDFDIASKGIKIFQYDHTIHGLPERHPLFTWEKTAISPDNRGPGFKTLSDIINDNSPSDDRDLILKCDIEGFEWPIFAATGSDVLSRFRQIVVEVHAINILADTGFVELIRRAVNNLTANHHVIHVHANNFGSWAILGGVPVPTVLEFTLLRKDRGTFVPSTEEFPTRLDMPNDPNRADFPLGQFRF